MQTATNDSGHVAVPVETATDTSFKCPALPVFEVIPMHESGDQWRGKLLDYRVWMKVGGASSVIYADENKALCEERAAKFRAMFQSAGAELVGAPSLSDAEIEAIWNGLGLRTKWAAYLLKFARALLSAQQAGAA